MSETLKTETPLTHTPGPWRVSMSGYSVKSNDDDMPIVANNPWGVGMREKDVPRWLVNAELIAAAPDLLEALRQIDALPSELAGEAWAIARAALAKAESPR